MLKRLDSIKAKLSELGAVESWLDSVKKKKQVLYVNQAYCLKRGLTRGDMEYLSPYYFADSSHAKYHIDDVIAYEKTCKRKPKKRNVA